MFHFWFDFFRAQQIKKQLWKLHKFTARYLKLRAFVLSHEEAYYFLNDPAALTRNLSRNGNKCNCGNKRRNKPNQKPNHNLNETTHPKTTSHTLPLKHPHRKQSWNLVFTTCSPEESPVFWAQSSGHIQALRIKCKITIPLRRDDRVCLNWWS